MGDAMNLALVNAADGGDTARVADLLAQGAKVEVVSPRGLSALKGVELPPGLSALSCAAVMAQNGSEHLKISQMLLDHIPADKEGKAVVWQAMVAVADLLKGRQGTVTTWAYTGLEDSFKDWHQKNGLPWGRGLSPQPMMRSRIGNGLTC